MPAAGTAVSRLSRLGSVPRELLELARRRELIYYLLKSHLRSSSLQTTFGPLWWLLEPLLFMLIYSFIVVVVFKRGGPMTPLFIFAALVPWKWFASSFSRSSRVLVENESMIKQIRFPTAILVVSKIGSELFYFFIGLGVLFAMCLAFGVTPAWSWLHLVPLVAVQLLFLSALSFYGAFASVFFRDTLTFINYLMLFWFFMSPAIYGIERIPEAYRGLYRLNPFATILPGYRSAILDGTAPDYAALGLIAAASLLVLWHSLGTYLRLETKFYKYL